AGDAMPARRGPVRVPEHLRVHVRVAVDEPRSDDVALGVDLLASLVADHADGDDAPVLDADVGSHGRQSRPVDDGPVADNQAVLHVLIPSSWHVLAAVDVQGLSADVARRVGRKKPAVATSSLWPMRAAGTRLAMVCCDGGQPG